MTKINYPEYTDDSFPTGEAFELFLQAGNKLKYDYVIVNDILYTMEEYDNDGKQVIWANRKYEMQMSVDTANRYGPAGYTDAIVSIYPAIGYRNDITYAE